MPVVLPRRPPSVDVPADGSGLTYAGLAAALLDGFRSNAFLHRRIVQLGKFEFHLQCARHEQSGMGAREYDWVWQRLVETCPPDLAAYPDGTILNEAGFVVRPTKDELADAREMIRVIRSPARRVFLTNAQGVHTADLPRD